MRCSCRVCGETVWMVQSESDALGCVCPECGNRCRDCLGTDTVVSRDQLASLAFDPRFAPESIQAAFDRDEEDDWDWRPPQIDRAVVDRDDWN